MFSGVNLSRGTFDALYRVKSKLRRVLQMVGTEGVSAGGKFKSSQGLPGIPLSKVALSSAESLYYPGQKGQSSKTC